MRFKILSLVVISLVLNNSFSQDITMENAHKVSSLKITTLSTMLANRGIGEWGYAALIESEGNKILFDTGSRPETVLQNAQTLGIDLSVVEDVFLSHNHGDHTGGLLTLREELKKINPNALRRIHVGKGIFLKRVGQENRMLEMKVALETDGVEFIEYETEKELFPGLWITGPIERVYNERNWSGSGEIITENGVIEDNIPEDQSIAITTTSGFVLVSGCGHAGIINTMEQIRRDIYDDRYYVAIGGFHLAMASDEQLQWTADKLKEFGIDNLNGAHCTGINSLFELRELLGFDRYHAVVGSIGDTFDLKEGIKASLIAR